MPSRIPKNRLLKKETIDKIVYYCSNCGCNCIPIIAKPFVETKLCEAIIVDLSK